MAKMNGNAEPRQKLPSR